MILRPFLVESTSCASYLFGCTSLQRLAVVDPQRRGLSSDPFSTIWFERNHNEALRHDGEDAFVQALLVEMPPPPAGQAEIVAANLSGRSFQLA